MPNIGEVISKGLEAVGIDPASETAGEIIKAYQPVLKVEFDESNVTEVIPKHLMIFENAKKNPGLESHFENVVRDKILSNTLGSFEKKMRKVFENAGGDVSEFDEVLTISNRANKFTKMAELMVSVGAGNGDEAEQVKKLKEKLNSVLDERDSVKQQYSQQFETLKQEYEGKINSLNQNILSDRLLSYAKSKIPFRNDLPGNADQFIANQLGQLTEKFEVKHNNNTFELYERGTDRRATAETNGQILEFDDVLESTFGPEWRKKAPDQPTHEPITGNGTNGKARPGVSANQRLREKAGL